MQIKFVCAECNSDDIEIRTWYNPNTNYIGEFVDDNEYLMCWCEECQEITRWKDIAVITPEEAKNYVLQDDDTSLGGTSMYGETLAEFMESANLSYNTAIEDIDEALRECGIKPIFEQCS